MGCGIEIFLIIGYIIFILLVSIAPYKNTNILLLKLLGICLAGLGIIIAIRMMS